MQTYNGHVVNRGEREFMIFQAVYYIKLNAVQFKKE